MAQQETHSQWLGRSKRRHELRHRRLRWCRRLRDPPLLLLPGGGNGGRSRFVPLRGRCYRPTGPAATGSCSVYIRNKVAGVAGDDSELTLLLQLCVALVVFCFYFTDDENIF